MLLGQRRDGAAGVRDEECLQPPGRRIQVGYHLNILSPVHVGFSFSLPVYSTAFSFISTSSFLFLVSFFSSFFLSFLLSFFLSALLSFYFVLSAYFFLIFLIFWF